ncbi:MAG: sulfotransferase [Pseudomonadota bacterium]
MPVKKLFLSVGAMKAGTTFMFNALSTHPQIFMLPEKELHFFAHVDGFNPDLYKAGNYALQLAVRFKLREYYNAHAPEPFPRLKEILSFDFRRHRLSAVMHNRFAKLEDAEAVRAIVRWYADRYLTSPIDDAWFDRVYEAAGERWASDFSNYNAILSDSGWERAKRLSEQLKVVYFLREPVDRLWSHVKFDLVQAGEGHVLDMLDEKVLIDILANRQITTHGRYDAIISNLRRHLTDDQLMVTTLEDTVSDFTGQMQKLEAFLGIDNADYSRIDPARKANKGVERPVPEHIRELLAQSIPEEDLAAYQAAVNGAL